MERSRDAHQAGFSLVELVMALAILAAVAALIAPRFANRSDRSALEAASERLAREIEAVKERARASSKKATVAVNVAQARLVVAGVDATGLCNGSGVLDLASAPYGVSILSASFGGREGIEFNAYGVPRDGGTIVLARRGETRTVRVTAAGSVGWK